MPERNRDDALDQMLRHVLAADGHATEEGCVDSETFAAWAAGTLQADEGERVERHLGKCARCQAVVAAFVRTAPPPVMAPSVWRRWHLGWVVPLATATTAVAVWFATPGRVPTTTDSDTLRATQVAEPPPAATPASPPAEREKAIAPTPGTVPEADTPARKRAAAPSDAEPVAPSEESNRFALEDRAASPPAQAPRTDLQKAERSLEVSAAAQPASAPPMEIAAPDGITRWRVTNGQRVEWRSQLSSEWQPVSLADASQITTGTSPSSSVCWLVGRGGMVFLTTDGTHFTRVTSPATVDLAAVTAVDDQRATITAVDGRRWSTGDRGVTWTRVP